MLLRKFMNISLSLILGLLYIIISIEGCSNQNKEPPTESPLITNPNKTPISEPISNKYRTFELRKDDIRLKYFKQPLFSFEYHEIFNLLDENINPEPIRSLYYDHADVMFTVQQVGLPYQILLIRVQKPGFLNFNVTSDIFKDWISKAQINGDNITTKQIMVSGIQVDYLEAFGDRKEHIIHGTLIYPAHQGSFRGVVFDYAGLIWSITITWDFLCSEPPEVQGYFEHVIETFKILD